MTSREPTINELIEQSSLGSDAAKRLRARTTDDQVELVRRLANLAAHSSDRLADLDLVAILLHARAALEQLEAETAAIAQARAELQQQESEASARAEQLISEAQVEATRLVSEAKARAARIEAAAYATAATPSDRSGTSTLVSTGRAGDPAEPEPPREDHLDLVAGPARYDSMEDHELLRLHVAGNPDTFGVLVTRHRDRMWAVAVRTLGDPEQAADALQEAFISASRRADSFRGDAKVTTWLHRIVVNACLDRIRRRQVRQAVPLPEDEDRAAELAGPAEDDPAEVRERRLDLLNALKQINPDQQRALVLVDLEGYSIEEAAAILGCAPGTVKSRCARGRARLLPLLRHWQTTRERTEDSEPGERPAKDVHSAR
jgi:RNA polymerase sigma factor (sigma-70 family)